LNSHFYFKFIRYINEANFPTLTGDTHTQLSVVLVSSEPPPNSKARKKEEAKQKKEQKQKQKQEQDKVILIRKVASFVLY
jgi:sorbitol-specific phosphotransferase system component IIBC